MSDDPIKFTTRGQTTSSGGENRAAATQSSTVAQHKLDNAKAAVKNRRSADE
jgi:hypothetical protein